MEDLLGKQIENYRIDSVLGRGGMGIVYRAYDEKLDRYVAIKVLAVKVVDKERFIERFKREAKNHAQLSHPNIVTVYGFIEYEDLLGIVMEYVDGESLERVLFKHTRLHVYDVVYILRQVLEGIGYAHSKGFVHRDIKPSNIILNSEGTVKIMDFGISKSLVDRSMTSTGSKVGTVYYMSPEQIKGDDVNHLTDIYAIGCTMYEMIFGKPPFYSETEYDIMDGHLNKDYQNPKTPKPQNPKTPVRPKVVEHNLTMTYFRICNKVFCRKRKGQNFYQDSLGNNRFSLFDGEGRVHLVVDSAVSSLDLEESAHSPAGSP